MLDMSLFPLLLVLIVFTLAWARFVPEPLNALAVLWSAFLVPLLWLALGRWLGTVAVVLLIGAWRWHFRRLARERLAPGERCWQPPPEGGVAKVSDNFGDAFGHGSSGPHGTIVSNGRGGVTGNGGDFGGRGR